MRHKIRIAIAIILSIVLCVPSFATQASLNISAPKVSIETTSSGNPKLTWGKVSGATGYRVFRKTSTDSKYVKVKSTTKLSFTDTKWSAGKGTTVKYYVKAYYKDSKGNITWSKKSTVKNWAVPGAKRTLPSPTPKPTPKPTQVPTRSGSSEKVYIPTHGGTKYHKKSNCSGMYDPEYVTKSEAESRGFGPCGRCYK